MRNLMPVNLFLGFDPAGMGNFGWSICREVDGVLERIVTGLANDALDATNAVRYVFENGFLEGHARVRAAGIDAPLTWSRRGDDRGFRQTDRALIHLLEPIGGPTNRVLSVNSLAGAVAVQGVLLVRHLSAVWDLAITESHPKALEYLLENLGQHRAVHQMALALTANLNNAPGNDHERDATLSAVSAWAAIRRRTSPNWQNLYDGDDCLFNPSGIPVSYWMPIPG